MHRGITVSEKAPAKINLGLRIVNRRPDGFHDIETVFVALQWYDRIDLAPSPEITFTCSVPDLPVDGANLCVQAALTLRRHAGVREGARIHLEKRLPWAAGLGGGSSDAAATLRGLCKLWDLDPAPGELQAIAAGLGSDVPFFLNPKPSLGRGRGDELSPLPASDSKRPFEIPHWIVVVVPPIRISSRDAYGRARPGDFRGNDLADLVVNGSMAQWRAHVVNDFEAILFPTYPELESLKSGLYEAGAEYASLSGSGSAVFGLFLRKQDAERSLGGFPHPGWLGKALL